MRARPRPRFMLDGTPMHWKTKLYEKLYWELDGCGCDTVAICNRASYGTIFVSVRRPAQSAETAPYVARPAKRRRRAVVPKGESTS